MEQMLEQLKRRTEGNRKATSRAADIFMSMVDRSLLRQLRINTQEALEADQLEQELTRQGVFFRQIQLEGDWWRHTTGKLLAFLREDDTPVVLTPGFASYSFIHPHTERRIVINNRLFGHASAASILKTEAFSLTQSLPDKQLTLRELGRFAWRSLSTTDLCYIALACVSVVLLTMFTPYVTKLIFSEVIPSGSASQLLPVAILLFSATLGMVMLQVTRSLVVFRVKDKLEYSLQTSLMTRLLHLPATFFRQWSAGDLSSRVLSLSHFSALLTENILTTILSVLFTGILFIQFFIYGGPLLFIGIGALLLELFFILLNYHYVKKVQNSVTPHRSRMFGFLYELLGGIQKIRTNGAEERVFQLWAEHFAYTEPNSAYQPLMYTYSGSLAFVTKMLPMIITMWAAWSYKLALSDYIAYCAVLGIALDTVGQMETIMKQLGRVMPQARLCQPILEAVPEIKDNQLMITHLEGSINIIGLRFRYSKSDPWLFDGFNLHIEPGEFIGITGPSSCGKSTLLRLLLGFEDPTEGYIYYDRFNLRDVNKPSLRRNCVSVVMQNGRLIEGTLLDNILFTAPDATEEEAWEAACMVSLDEDIKHMPLGMQTPITEDGYGLSGGQRQRIMLARALAQHPDVLLLDEATSALDNVTQQCVAERLKQLQCTRIAISQRPDTLRYCDRIITL